MLLELPNSPLSLTSLLFLQASRCRRDVYFTLTFIALTFVRKDFFLFVFLRYFRTGVIQRLRKLGRCCRENVRHPHASTFLLYSKIVRIGVLSRVFVPQAIFFTKFVHFKSCGVWGVGAAVDSELDSFLDHVIVSSIDPERNGHWRQPRRIHQCFLILMHKVSISATCVWGALIRRNLKWADPK